jgi:hypothetical protein
MFVTGCLSFAWAFRHPEAVWPQRLEPLPDYAIGTAAAFWSIEWASA